MDYIDAMISRERESEVTSISVTDIKRSGHISAVSSINVISDKGIMIPVKGMAMRFVRRKCLGNESK